MRGDSEGLREGRTEGRREAEGVPDGRSDVDGPTVGRKDGMAEGARDQVGRSLGTAERLGTALGAEDRSGEGRHVGGKEGAREGLAEGEGVGARVGPELKDGRDVGVIVYMRVGGDSGAADGMMEGRRRDTRLGSIGAMAVGGTGDVDAADGAFVGIVTSALLSGPVVPPCADVAASNEYAPVAPCAAALFGEAAIPVSSSRKATARSAALAHCRLGRIRRPRLHRRSPIERNSVVTA